MDITYKNKKIEKVCTDAKVADRTYNRKGQYAVDLVHPYRLIFEKHGNEIQIAHIMEIVDYH